MRSPPLWERWLTMVSPEDTGGVEVVLLDPADEPAHPLPDQPPPGMTNGSRAGQQSARRVPEQNQEDSMLENISADGGVEQLSGRSSRMAI